MASAQTGQVGQTILPFTRTLTPLANGQFLIELSASGFTVIPTAFDAPTQSLAIAKVTNAADLTSTVAPGGLISIWGNGFNDVSATAGSFPLPTNLGNTCLFANSTPLALTFVSPTQLNAQLPFDSPSGLTLTLSSASGRSAPFSFPVQPTAPAIFRTAAGGPFIIRTVDGKFITNDTPVHLNEVLNIYMTGLGAVNQQVKAGDAVPANPHAATVLTPTITLGGADIWTLSSELVPGMTGVYQVNAQIPFHHIPTGDSIPLTIRQGGAATTVFVKVLE
jgi:uncharacterized protein (TIGR03437 family)